ncbi:MAG: ribonuclease III [Candidatus Dadabacteria bacterium]|nr:ribonuclease III [Candidatus Dadabacteria bacterium]NIX15674.1 ribonuclease III [Candidatus Dadabacteria bacterium]NIY22216.1 ribonuclease III [Candidatus Dadabacteria bacterium]
MIKKILEYEFKDKELLKTALTHSSYANEYSVQSNERLEFLGDAVIGCVTAKVLYKHFPDYPEGNLSKIKSAIVSRENLGVFARDINLQHELLLGKGEETSGGREKISNLSGAFEAVIGAIYLDSGYTKVYSVISKLISKCLAQNSFDDDYKTNFQEISQKLFKSIPRYKVVQEQGPSHNKSFYVVVEINKKVFGNGCGKSKKSAEQAAARQGLLKIKDIARV